MLTDAEKNEIVTVIRNSNAVASNLTKMGKLVEAGCVHSAIQAIRFLHDKLTAPQTPVNDEPANV